MKKNTVFASLLLSIISFPLVSCSPDSSSSSGDSVYLVFESDIINEPGGQEEEEITCTLTRDNKATFNIDIPSLRWKVDESLVLFLYDSEKITYVEYLKAYYKQCFFYEIDGLLYRFIADDKDFRLSEDYAPPYKQLAQYVFTGNASVNFGRLESWIYLLGDEQKTVYMFPLSVRPSLLPDGAYIEYGWKFENNVFSFDFGGWEVSSEYCSTPGKRGYRIRIDGFYRMECFHVLDDGFDWRDYQDSDFETI